MIATKRILHTEKPNMVLEAATLYDSKKGLALRGDVFIYQHMVIFCAYGEPAEKRPMYQGECCFIYASGYTDCFARNGVYVMCQMQQGVTFSGEAQRRIGLKERCEALE